jgi:hypothetical protein
MGTEYYSTYVVAMDNECPFEDPTQSMHDDHFNPLMAKNVVSHVGTNLYSMPINAHAS